MKVIRENDPREAIIKGREWFVTTDEEVIVENILGDPIIWIEEDGTEHIYEEV